MFSELKIFKQYDFFELKLLSFVYESVNMISPVFFYNFFEIVTAVHQYDPRQASKSDILMTQENTLRYGLRSVRYAGAKFWNKTPRVIKQSTTVTKFRHKLKMHLFSTRYHK